LGALATAIAQSPPEVRIRSGPWYPPGVVIAAEANLVELGVTVRDREGHPVGGLKAADFEVLDDNRPREIAIFSEQRSPAAAAASPVAGAAPASAAAGGLLLLPRAKRARSPFTATTYAPR